MVVNQDCADRTVRVEVIGKVSENEELLIQLVANHLATLVLLRNETFNSMYARAASILINTLYLKPHP